jgi:hypothetical protein
MLPSAIQSLLEQAAATSAESVASPLAPQVKPPTPHIQSVHEPPSMGGSLVGVTPLPQVNEMYEMLKALMLQVEALTRAIEVPGAAAPLVAGDASAEVAADQTVEVLELAMRRVAIAPVTRAKLASGLAPFVHPVTGDVATGEQSVASRPFTATALGLRFDGVTVPRTTAPFPQVLEFRLSFGWAPEARVGPATLSAVGEDPELGQTFSIVPPPSAAGGRRGVTWLEPVDANTPATDLELLAPYKRGKSRFLHVEVVDAASGFYVGTAAVPMAEFERPVNCRHAQRSLDVPVKWDDLAATALTGVGNAAAAERHPFERECATLHVTVCGFGFDPAAAPAAVHHDVNGGATRVVEVKRLPGSVSATHSQAAAHEETTKDAVQSSTTGLHNMAPDRQDLHHRRAMYVKKALQAGQLPISAPKAQAASSTGGADRLQMDLQMRMVEHERAQRKADCIAQHLRDRITTSANISVARGVPHLVELPFQNPYPVTMSFALTFPPAADSRDGNAKVALAAHSSMSSGFVLGPKEEGRVRIVARQDSTFTGAVPPLQCHVSTERGELVRIVNVTMTLAKPIVTRRQQLVGDPGKLVRRTFYVRSFTTETLGVDSGTIEGLLSLTDAISLWPRVQHRGVRVESRVNVDNVMRGHAHLWETATIEALIPDEGDDVALIHFYDSEARERHVETWEVQILPCITQDARSVNRGETSSISLAIACDFCYAFGGVSVAPPAVSNTGGTSTVILRVKPMVAGLHVLRLHAFSGNKLKRFDCRFNASEPKTTHSCTIWLTPRDITLPIRRQLAIENRTGARATFTVANNFKEIATLSETVVPNVEPMDLRYVVLTIDLRRHPEEQRYPITVLVNDAADKTVDCYGLDVQVSSGHIAA